MSDTDRISGHTKTIALIGTPVEHSLSPAMHNTAFEHNGLDYAYLAYDIASPEQVPAVIEGMKVMGFAGANVTMPYKTLAVKYMDELSPAAELMQAVNTIVFEHGMAIGHNTDGAGFVRNIENHGIDYKGNQVTIVGAGGAGSAIFTQLALDGAGTINVFNRKDDFFEATAQRLSKLGEKTGCNITLFDLADKDALEKSVAGSVLFINATRVGMGSLADESVLDEKYMHEGLAVADTVYDPRETKLIKDAKAKGLVTAPGLGMLLSQAAIGEELWTGHAMPVELIEEKFFN